MKRFIIISLLCVFAMPMMACLWWDTTNSYLFSMYEQKNFKNRVERICNDNWKAYLGSTEEYFWFNADDAIKAARKKGDILMVSYLQNLKKYLNCVDIEQRKQYEWNYPTPQDINNQKLDLLAVRTYALGKTKTKLRSQHALLYMRCNMILGRHQDNINFWEQTASKFIETVYKDMMKNIYAGALYKSGRTAEAGEMFAEMDDYESLMTIYYKKRSFQAISQQYQQNPNAKVLPFLLQDFVNNAQEAEDAKTEGALGGKLFIRDINQQESAQMQQFCQKVVREGKTETPIMWQSAKAWLEYLAGKKQEALKDINAAMQMEGTQRMKDNARVLKFFMTTATAKPNDSFDTYFTEELTWLQSKQQTADGFFDSAMRRLSYQAIVPHYQNKPEQQLALMIITNNTDYIERMETMPVTDLEKFFYYTKTPGDKPFDQFLQRQFQINDSSYIELIGTKYMRLAKWDKAIEWLSKLPLTYFNYHHSQEYLYYSTARKYDVEPWITRQWLDSSNAYKREQKWDKNIKLEFCKEMQAMESSLNLLQDKALDQRYYDLAVRYAQASLKGDCWWLLRNSKNIYDSVRVNEIDFGAKAVELLQKTTMTKDKNLKLKAMFAMGWQELYNATPGAKLWTSNEWNEQAADYIRQYNRESWQFRAFQNLYNMVENTPNKPAYITKCDEYDQFRQYYSKHK
ncbi:hypothetical protein [Xylanibacter ruminicola]|uniref:hypothetical protein n=1 Tax=Xylanibacter ruminicola TaxID=839 RepID=UPI0012D3239C|nr:hypothetical protein [Xylanibacter ruminicola]